MSAKRLVGRLTDDTASYGTYVHTYAVREVSLQTVAHFCLSIRDPYSVRVVLRRVTYVRACIYKPPCIPDDTDNSSFIGPFIRSRPTTTHNQASHAFRDLLWGRGSRPPSPFVDLPAPALPALLSVESRDSLFSFPGKIKVWLS